MAGRRLEVMPILELRDPMGTSVGRWDASSPPVAPQPVRTAESDPYGLALKGAEPGVDYDIMIGDLDLAQIVGGSLAPGGVVQQRFGDGSVYWAEAHYFESGRGRTMVTLRYRREKKDAWRSIMSVPVYVVPTKLGEERYEAMVGCLQELCAGLLLDLIGKSRRSYEHMLLRRGISYASKETELRRVRSVWSQLAPLIQRMAASPMRVPRRTLSSGLYWGDKALSPTSMASLARRGFSPRSTQRPVRGTLTRMVETADILEHAFLLGFLRLLHARIGECIDAIGRQTDAIEGDRAFRDVIIGDSPSLYVQVDIPRLRRLAGARREAAVAGLMIANVINTPLFADIHPRLGGLGRHNFCQNELYRSALRVMREYLASASFWFGDRPQSADATVKLTSRLYEHWVFLRLVDAFRAAGAKLSPWDEFLRESVRSHFTLEFDRGLRFEGPIGGDRAVRCTFEPWITSKLQAEHSGMSVYKDGEKMAWSPDVLIELLIAGVTRYALVLDCKYSRVIREDAWRTDKYLRIRAVATGSQVVRQLWLVHPGQHCSINPNDDAVRFDHTGVNRPPDESVLGTIGALPGSDGCDEQGVLQRFATGTLSYLRRIDLAPQTDQV